MRIKENFVLRELAQSWIVMPVAALDAEPVHGFWRLSRSGALLWQTLEQECQMEDLVRVLMETYHIDRDTAAADARQFVQKLEQMGCLESRA